MAEGHIEFTRSVCVSVCMCFRLFVCVFQNRVWPIASSYMVGFENNLAQIIIITSQCVVNKNHVTKSKVKVTVLI